MLVASLQVQVQAQAQAQGVCKIRGCRMLLQHDTATLLEDAGKLDSAVRLSNKAKSCPLTPLEPDCPRHETLSGVGLIVGTQEDEQRRPFPLLVQLCGPI